MSYDPDTGQRFVTASAFCAKCGDGSVPYMDSHLTDSGWLCDPSQTSVSVDALPADRDASPTAHTDSP